MSPAVVKYVRGVGAMARRSISVMFSKPSLILPSLVFPLFFFAAFAGGLSGLAESPDFDYPNYTTFQYIFVLMQSAIFGGVFTGFAIASDFELGFARRLLLAAHSRSVLIGGYVVTALFRAVVVWAVVTAVALATGAEIDGGVGDLLGILSIAILLNFAATLFASGMAMRFRTLQAAPLIQLPAFLIIMTAPVYVPRELIEGWVASVADVNPMTAMLEAGRNLIIGAPAEALLAMGIAAGLIVLTLVWARTGLRRAEAAG